MCGVTCVTFGLWNCDEWMGRLRGVILYCDGGVGFRGMEGERGGGRRGIG